MEMRDGFMRPPRNRGGLMWPPVPLRGRNMMGMDRMRLPHHLRPGMMRGGPPVPPFVGRGMAPPHARMLPRPPIHPPGPMLGPRGILPRPMLPPRALGIDAGDASDTAQVPVNGAVKEPLKNVKDGNVPKNNIPGPIPNQIGNQMANRNIRGRVRPKVNQNIGHPPLQNIHPTPHHPQPPLVQPNSGGVNPPHMSKHIHPIQSQINSGGAPPQAQPHPMQHQPSLRGGRNGMNPRNRGPGGMGRGGLMNIPPLGGGVVNRGSAMMNRGGPPNLASRGGHPVPPGRGNMMGALPPPPVPYAPAPPPPQSSYPVPPPVLGPQGPVKRGGPPMGMPPPMPPKRVRYDSNLPANGYGQYQQQPPPAQAPYSTYDVPPPSDMYSNPMPPPPFNSSQSQNYNSSDYNYPSGQQSGSYSANAQYSSYNNDPGYSSYSGGSSAYDPSVDYSNNPPANNSGGDPYGYKAAPSDSYGGYSNSNYYNSQAGYDDYSSGYMDGSGYGAPAQDSSYGQSVGTYNNYSY